MKGAALSDADIRDLVKECGLDWHRGFVPLFDGDPTNRYAVLVRAAIDADRRLTAEQGGAEPPKPFCHVVNMLEGLPENPSYIMLFDGQRLGNGFTHTALYTGEQLVAALTTQPQAEPADARIYWHASLGWQVEWLTPAPNGGQSNYYRHTEVKTCRDDGRCQYAIDHGAEGLGHCPKGKCTMPLAAPAPTEPT